MLILGDMLLILILLFLYLDFAFSLAHSVAQLSECCFQVCPVLWLEIYLLG